MTLPAWANPTQGRTVTLPAVSQSQLRRAEDMLEIWGHENRRKDAEVADIQRAVTLGVLIDQGPVAMLAVGHYSGLSPLAAECDAMIAGMPARKRKLLRLAYVRSCSGLEGALRMKWDERGFPMTEAGYWAELLSAKHAIARRLPE